MAKYELTDESGARYEVEAPDDMPEQDVLREFEQSMSAQQPAPAPQQEMGGLEKFGAGALQGGRDLINDAAAFVPDALSAVANQGSRLIERNGLDAIFGGSGRQVGQALDSEGDRVAAMNREQEQGYADKYRKDNDGFDYGRVAGNIAATIPIASVGMAGKAHQGLKALATGLGLGATQSDSGETSEERWADRRFNAGMGAVSAGAGHVVGKGLARVISPNSSRSAQLLKNEGVGLTPGMTLGGAAKRTEDALTSVWGLGDMIKSSQRRAFVDVNRAVFNRALKPIGEKLPKGMSGREALNFTANKLGQKYDDLLPNIQVKADKVMSDDLTDILDEVGDFSSDARMRLITLMDNRMSKRFTNNVMQGPQLKALQEDFGKDVAKLAAGSPDDRAMAEGIKDALEAIQRSAERSSPGTYGAQLKSVNEGWANYVRGQVAGSAQKTDDGIFSPEQLNSAVRSLDKSTRKANFGKEKNLMQDLSGAALTQMGAKVADSGTPYRAIASGLALNMIDPTLAIGAGAAALPYTKPGQRLTSALLAGRQGAKAKAISGAVGKGIPLLGAAGGAPVLSPLMSSYLNE